MRTRTLALLLTLGLSTLASAAPLTFALAGEPVNLDPATTGDANSAYVEAQIYNSLLDFKPGTMTVVPDLAKSWTVSTDGLTWTFKLRQDVKFTDGTPFNAEAVRFNVLRWWDPEAPYGAKATGKSFLNWQQNLGGFKGEAGSILKDVRVTDPYTVQLVLQKPFPSLGAVLAGGGSFGIASPTAVKKNAQQYGTPAVGAVGTGPYVFKGWTSGDNVVLTRNPNFYKPGLPKSESITFRFIKDASARLNELKAGTVDMATDLLPDQLAAIKTDARLRPALRTSLNVGYLAFNTTYKPLANAQVRTALAMAINRRAIVDGFWNGLGVESAHLTPPVFSAAYSPAVSDYAYDPTAAKKMLSDAGYPQGFTLDLWYMPVARPYYPSPKAIAEAMAADLTAAGIKVNLRTEDWGKYLEDRQAGKFQAFMLGQVSTSDPIASYSSIMGPSSVGDIGWKNAAFDKALDAALRQPTDAARVPYFQTIDELLFREAVRVPIVHAKLLAVSSVKVRGWVPSPNGNEPLSSVTK